MVFNESFWLAISIVIFVCLVFKHIKSFVSLALLNRIQSIDSKFKEVLIVSEEADALLKEYKLLHRSSKKKVRDILESAQLEITHLKEQSEKNLLIKLNSRSKNILNKINNNEQKVLSELRLESVQLAISTSIDILSSAEADQHQKRLIKSSIDVISSQVKINTLSLS